VTLRLRTSGGDAVVAQLQRFAILIVRTTFYVNLCWRKHHSGGILCLGNNTSKRVTTSAKTNAISPQHNNVKKKTNYVFVLKHAVE